MTNAHLPNSLGWIFNDSSEPERRAIRCLLGFDPPGREPNAFALHAHARAAARDYGLSPVEFDTAIDAARHRWGSEQHDQTTRVFAAVRAAMSEGSTPVAGLAHAPVLAGWLEHHHSPGPVPAGRLGTQAMLRAALESTPQPVWFDAARTRGGELLIATNAAAQYRPDLASPTGIDILEPGMHLANLGAVLFGPASGDGPQFQLLTGTELHAALADPTHPGGAAFEAAFDVTDPWLPPGAGCDFAQIRALAPQLSPAVLAHTVAAGSSWAHYNADADVLYHDQLPVATAERFTTHQRGAAAMSALATGERADLVRATFPHAQLPGLDAHLAGAASGVPRGRDASPARRSAAARPRSR